jgi:hypothetical protein
MHTLAPSHPCFWPPPLTQALRHWLTELRIDVFLPDLELHEELERLNERLPALRPAAHALTGLTLPRAGFRVLAREADGEHFLYVIDTFVNRIVAYITFSRLVEINRQADRYLRAPHAKVAIAYRRQGIAGAIYRWWLDSGQSVITGARQSPAARALWLSLARRYPMTYVRIDNKRLHNLGDQISDNDMDALNVRAVLLGRGCTPGRWMAPAMAPEESSIGR